METKGFKIKKVGGNDELIVKIDSNNFISKFNPETGYYVRTGVGAIDGPDAFMASFPELIDIGIMGSCEHGASGLCVKAGIQCYQGGLSKKEPNMALEDFKTIIDEFKLRTFQVALGGRGDVNKHENFKEIMEYCRANDVVPNYTTSGLNLTEEEVQISKDNCGAVAVSWYRQDHTLRAIDMFVKAGLIVNIHYVLGNNTIDEAIQRLENEDFPEGIEAVIFLLHKPVGQGNADNVLNPSDPRVAKFFGLFNKGSRKFKVGIDSCCTPGVIHHSENVNRQSIDTCEGARFSMYISPDMKALPCSFDQEHRWAVDLKTHTIQEAWDSPKFKAFRRGMEMSCPGCKDRIECMGGCPIKQEVVLCHREERLSIREEV